MGVTRLFYYGLFLSWARPILPSEATHNSAISIESPSLVTCTATVNYHHVQKHGVFHKDQTLFLYPHALWSHPLFKNSSQNIRLPLISFLSGAIVSHYPFVACQ